MSCWMQHRFSPLGFEAHITIAWIVAREKQKANEWKRKSPVFHLLKDRAAYESNYKQSYQRP